MGIYLKYWPEVGQYLPTSDPTQRSDILVVVTRRTHAPPSNIHHMPWEYHKYQHEESITEEIH